MLHDIEQVDEEIEQLLRETDLFILNKLYRADAGKLNDLIRYHLEGGGSQVRARLALSASLALGLDRTESIALAASCELIHNASLLHDDIQDGDSERRGREAAWLRFDTNTAMCAGTYMLSAAFNTIELNVERQTEINQQLHRSVADLICGQSLDLESTANVISLQKYLNIAQFKSGSLLALPLELSMLAGLQKKSLSCASSAGTAFAVAYQITDDLNDADHDLARGTCNIVSVLQATNLDRAQAERAAVELAKNYLNEAREQAAQLPAGSGKFLISLCEKLNHKFLTSTEQSCEIR